MQSPRPISPHFYALPQIAVDDLPALADAGFSRVICNRPDGEDMGQPTEATMRAAAEAAGLSFDFIPVGPAGIQPTDITRMSAIIEAGDKTLAYCRSGTRSTILHAYAAASLGRDIDGLVRDAAAAGYDLSAHAPRLAALSGK